MKLLRTELEDQEKSLKASVAAQVSMGYLLENILMQMLQEKKAHENWVAARQAERRLTEVRISTTKAQRNMITLVTQVQSEMSVLRNRLTVAESKNSLLEQVSLAFTSSFY